MKGLTILWLILGAIIMIVGGLSFIFAYPYCNGCTDSGPLNLWELILMFSYERKGWLLIIGGSISFLSLFWIFRKRKVQF